MAQTQPVNSTSLKLQYSGVLILPTKDGHAVGKDDCYYNACAKSFFHALKLEAFYGERFNTRKKMRQAVFEYVNVDYNLTRRHSANACISPVLFDARQVT